MIVKLGETKSQVVKDATIDGILFNIYLQGSALNAEIAANAFLPSEITLKVELKRKKTNITIVQDNLQVLGLYAAINSDINSWIKGNTLTAHGEFAKHEKLVSLFIPFGGDLNIKDDDELLVQVIAGRAVFTNALDLGVSYIEFNENSSIGYELATPQIITQVIQSNITKERFSLGDNVAKISIINFDKTTINPTVLNSLSLASDKLSLSLNFFDVLNRYQNVFFPNRINPRILNAGAAESWEMLQGFPQSFVIYQNEPGDSHGLNNVVLDVSFNGSQVNPSQNYICATRFIMTAETYVVAVNRAAKHSAENTDKLLSTVTPG